jgi:hypothetical protein
MAAKKMHVVIDFPRRCLRCKLCGATQGFSSELPLPMFVSIAKMFGDIHADCTNSPQPTSTTS